MAMPEAAMHKDGGLTTRKNEVGLSGKFGPVEAEAIA